MKILIADSFPATHAEALTQAGHQCTIEPGLDENSLPDAIKDNTVLIVRSTKVNAATIDAGSALQLVIRAGAGTNTIDKAHAAKNGVKVCNVPGANSVAVAELAMGLMLSIDRNIANNVSDLRNNTWNKKKYSQAQGLHGQRLGILGMGAIGIALAERANAFGMEIHVIAKPGRTGNIADRLAKLNIVEHEEQHQLLQASDIVSLHLPSNEQTNSMVNAEFLSHMKPGAMLINTSRGELVDEEALLAAMNEKGIRPGLDVYQNEPGASDNTFHSAIAGHPNVCGTHHIGASTEQAQTAVADGVIRVIESFEADQLIFCVNS